MTVYKLKSSRIAQGRASALLILAALTGACSPVAPSSEKAIHLNGPDALLRPGAKELFPFKFETDGKKCATLEKSPEAAGRVSLTLSDKERAANLKQFREKGSTSVQVAGDDIISATLCLSFNASDDDRQSAQSQEDEQSALVVAIDVSHAAGKILNIAFQDNSDPKIQDRARPRIKQMVLYLTGNVKPVEPETN
jgi:hypothetical protein